MEILVHSLKKCCDIFKCSRLLITFMDTNGCNVCHPIDHQDSFGWFPWIVSFPLVDLNIFWKLDSQMKNVSLSDRQGPCQDHLVSLRIPRVQAWRLQKHSDWGNLGLGLVQSASASYIVLFPPLHYFSKIVSFLDDPETISVIPSYH